MKSAKHHLFLFWKRCNAFQAYLAPKCLKSCVRFLLKRFSSVQQRSIRRYFQTTPPRSSSSSKRLIFVFFEPCLLRFCETVRPWNTIRGCKVNQILKLSKKLTSGSFPTATALVVVTFFVIVGASVIIIPSL